MSIKTALITGASSGIGKALSYAFAKRGYHLVLVGRNHERLKSVAAHCSHVTSHVIVQDLSRPGSAQAIFDELRQLDIPIDILVNNAGLPLKGPFEEIDFQAEHEIIQLQIVTPLDLIRQAIPYMKEKKEGHVINIGSIYSFSAVPLESVYAASKAFLFSFSLSLQEELQGSGISVTVVCPGMTRTLFWRRRGGIDKDIWINMEADLVAEATYKGMVKKKLVVIPGWINRFYVGIVRILPVNWVAPFVHWAIYSLCKL